MAMFQRMPHASEETTQRDRFESFYSRAQSQVMLAIERSARRRADAGSEGGIYSTLFNRAFTNRMV